MALPIPEFLDRDVNNIVSDMILFYEAATGKTLQPAQPERLLINVFAYREALLRNAVNDAALQNLLQFSVYPVLDYLVALVGTVRIPAQAAKTNLEFTLLSGHPALTIPAGTRVSNSDGSAVFSTIDPTFVALGIDTIVVPAQSTNTGPSFNGFLASSIIVLLDTFAQFDTVTNLDQTSGGSDEETDDQLRERAKLAISAFSVAGPVNAYKYFAFSANPDILDVSIDSPIPGQVNIYPLTAIVPTPTTILNQVQLVCSDEKVRPLTDTVVVLAPTASVYTIQADLTLYTGADDVAITQQVTDLLNNYKDQKGSKLGMDIIINQILALCMVDGVYDVNLVTPIADIVVSQNEFGNCTSVVVNVVGYNNG